MCVLMHSVAPEVQATTFVPTREQTSAPWPHYEDMNEEEFFAKFILHLVDGDGNCQFQAIAMGVHETNPRQSRIRNELLELCKTREDEVTLIMNGRQSLESVINILENDGNLDGYGINVTLELAEWKYNVAV